jgi:hypothetical protein
MGFGFKRRSVMRRSTGATPIPTHKSTLLLTPTALTFNGIIGDGRSYGSTVVITNIGTGNYTNLGLGATQYQSGSGWLVATLLDAYTLLITVTTGALTAGSYVAVVPVTESNATNSPQLVTVTFVVGGAAPAVLQLSRSADDFRATAGVAATNPVNAVVGITNQGASPFAGPQTAIQYHQGSGWLTSVATMTTLTTTPNGTSLTAGLYQATVTVTDANAAAPVTYTVTVNCAGVTPQPILLLSPNSIPFVAPTGSTTPQVGIVIVTNSGAGTLGTTTVQVTHISGSGWCTAQIVVDSANQRTTTITVDPSGLSAGAYVAEVAHNDTLAINSGAKVNVTLTVQATGGAYLPPAYGTPTFVTHAASTDLLSGDPYTLPALGSFS